MSHSVALSDAAFETLRAIATRDGVTPEAAIERLIAAASASNGPYYETEDWFRHLGMSEDEIREARERAELDDADA